MRVYQEPGGEISRNARFRLVLAASVSAHEIFIFQRILSTCSLKLEWNRFPRYTHRGWRPLERRVGLLDYQTVKVPFI